MAISALRDKTPEENANNTEREKKQKKLLFKIDKTLYK